MAEPREYLIIRALQASLQAIAQVDGYHYDVTSVAVKLDPNQDVESLINPGGPRPIIILQVTSEDWKYLPASQVELKMPVRVHWIHESDAAVDESWLRTYYRGCSDVERAVAQDNSRGGYARETRVVDRSYAQDPTGGSRVWAQIDLSVYVDRSFGEPDA